MPATVTTRESFAKDTSAGALQAEVDLRIQAGAINCKVVDGGDSWVIETVWNVIGQQ